MTADRQTALTGQTGHAGQTGQPDQAAAAQAVRTAAQAARAAAADLAQTPSAALDDAIKNMADHLTQDQQQAAILRANSEDVQAARDNGTGEALIDRLRLDDRRLKAMAAQLHALAEVPAEPTTRYLRDLPGDLVLEERRRPVGVIGANFEARPNVVIDVASQFVKSRNAGVLRTGSAALRSAIALADEVIVPALQQAALPP